MIVTDSPGVNERLLIALAVARKSGTPAYEIAAECHVHPSDLSRWAYGRSRPSLEAARRVAKVLGQPSATLFPDPTDTLNPQTNQNATRPASGPGVSEIEGTHAADDVA